MQRIPTNWGQIFNLATKMYNGLVAFAAAIPVTMVTAAQMLASKTAFKNAGNTFNTRRTALNNAHIASRPAQENLYEWLLTVRAVLARQLGSRWSPAWAEAGYVTTTTQVPDTIEGRIALGLSLVTYYTNNPTFEVPDLDVTEAKATELTAAAVAGQTNVATAEQALRDADNVRQPARTDLLGLMSTLIANLNKKLAPNDPRWLAFGLQMPSTPTTPGKPQNVTATLNADGAILVQCDAEALAHRYRGRMMILGVDTKYRLVFSGPEPMGLIPGIQPGMTVQIIMQAVNDGSQGVASEPLLFTMPIAAKPESAAADSELAPLAAIAPNGNSSSHGNGNGITPAVNRIS